MVKKVLNLYAGIGGNRKLWEDVEVTAVEYDPKIASIYQDFFPDDTVIVTDAHEYLLEHYGDSWDFIWSSPPCPSHSHIRKELAVEARKQNKAIYPDMKLYEEILFLQGYISNPWVVENVISWYEPLIKPYDVANHYFWSNFNITNLSKKSREHHANIKGLEVRKGFDLSKYHGIDKIRLLRNYTESELGNHIFECAFDKGNIFKEDVW